MAELPMMKDIIILDDDNMEEDFDEDENINVQDLQSKPDELPSQIWLKNSIKDKSIKYMKWSELTQESKIGSGNFGSVFKAYWSQINNHVICKKLTNMGDIQNQFWDALQNEIQMQSRAHVCENIVRFLGITQEPQSDHYCIIMEYADGGNLQEYLGKNFSSLNWNQKYQLAIDITNGLHYLHKENILHRDLHAKNIVIQKERAKITDFGNAKEVETQTKLHKGAFGIIPYMAPELLRHNNSQPPPFSVKSDIYSLGVLFWELSSGCPPFRNRVEIGLIYHIINGTREEKVPNTPPGYCDLYTSCWNGNPEVRPIVEDVYCELKSMLSPRNDKMQNEKIDIIEDNEGSSSAIMVDNLQTSGDDEYPKSTMIDFTKNE